VVGLEAPVAAENVPAAQRVQKVELEAPAVTEYRPVVQGVQVEEVDAPVAPENVPAVQRVQLVRAVVSAYDPVVQVVQVPPVPAFPVEHWAHLVAPSVRDGSVNPAGSWPSGHTWQAEEAVCAVLGPCLFAGQ
jgi:hypothetical protein